VEAWFRLDSFTNSWVPLFQKGGGTGVADRELTLWINNSGYVHFTSANASGLQNFVNTQSGAIETGRWYHVAGVLDRTSGRMEVYLDGELAGVNTNVLGAETISTAGPVLLGDTDEVNSGFGAFLGDLDGVRLWNTARSQSQIRNNLTRDVAESSLGLIGDWRFSELSGTQVRDSSGNGHDGTFSGPMSRVNPAIHASVVDSPADFTWIEARADHPDVLVAVNGRDISVVPTKGFRGTTTITVIAHDGTGAAGSSNGRTSERRFDVTVGDNAVYGIKFDDRDGDGERDGRVVLGSGAAEPGVDGVKVFVDVNGNRIHDAGEVYTWTDANGDYMLGNVVSQPATAASASGSAVTDVRGGTSTQSFETNQVFGNDIFGAFLRSYTEVTNRTFVRLSVTLDGLASGSIDLTPERTADNASFADLEADLNALLAELGLDDEVVASVVDGVVSFRTTDIGKEASLRVTTSTIFLSSPVNFSRTSRFFSFSSSPGIGVANSGLGGLGIDATGVSAVGADAPIVVVEVPSGGWTPTSNGEFDGNGNVGVRNVQFVAPGEIVTGVDFANRHVADVSIEGPLEAVEGDLLAFTVRVSDPTPDTRSTFDVQWEVWSDAGALVASGFGTEIGFASPDEGDYRIEVNVTDRTSSLVSYPVMRSLVVRNADPVLSAAEDRSIGLGQPISLDGMTVSDAGRQDPLTVVVEWGDGASDSFVLPAGSSLDDAAAQFRRMTHEYFDEGRYRVRVGVTDGDGGTTVQRFNVQVINGAPIVFGIEDVQVEQGGLVILGPEADDPDGGDGDEFDENDEGGFEDGEVDFVDDGSGLRAARIAPIPEGAFFYDALKDTHEASIDWGDGTVSRVEIVTERGSTLRRLVGAHQYLNSGVFEAVLTVRDSQGFETRSAFKVTVANSAPTFENVPEGVSIDEGTVLDLDNLPDRLRDIRVYDAVADTLVGTIDWGDGSDPEFIEFDASVTEGTYSGGDIVNRHLYREGGVFTVRLQVSDGTVTTEAAFKVQVSHVAPVVVIGELGPVSEAETFTLSGEIRLGGVLDTATATISWGDGSQSEAQLELVAEGGDGTARVYRFSGDHAYRDDGEYAIVVSVLDDDGNAVESTTGQAVVDVAPSLGPIELNANGDLFETDGFSMELTFDDPGLDDEFRASIDWGDGSEPSEGATVRVDENGRWSVSGEHAYADDGIYTVSFTVFDADGGDGVIASREVVVRNRPHAVSATGTPTTYAGEPWTLTLADSDVAGDAVVQWIVNWGEGGPDVVIEGDPASVVHTFAATTVPVDRTVTVRAVDDDGEWTAESVVVRVIPNRLRVIAMDGDASGVSVRFNRAIEGTEINLYNAAVAGMGAADVVVRNSASFVLNGTLIVDADKQGFRWTRTGGAMADGRYHVTLVSHPAAFREAGGGALLDGNGDGVTGDNHEFEYDIVAAPGTVVVSMPDFMRGPGQSVSLPAIATGRGALLPVRASNLVGVTSASFVVAHDPALLLLSGAGIAGGIEGVATLTAVDGGTRIDVVFAAAITADQAAAAGNVLVNLSASVPVTATYGAAQRLDLLDLRLNRGDAVVSAVADAGIHVVGYLGDGSGNGAYNTADVQRLQRVVSRLDSGFAAWPNVDPVLVGDVNASGTLTSTDASVLLRRVQGVPRAEIPALPAGIGPITFVGPDPLVRVGDNPAGMPGATVSVPLTLDTAAGLDSVQARVAYDATKLELVGVRQVDLTADFRWRVVDSATPGVVSIDLTRNGPLAGGSGRLLEIDFRIRDGVAPGSTPVDLQFVALNETRLTLQPEPQPGFDPTDGFVQILATPTPALARTAAASTTSPEATRFTAPTSPTLLPSGAPAGVSSAPASSVTSASTSVPDWNGQAWAKDLTQRLGQLGDGTLPPTPSGRSGLLAALSRGLLGNAKR
jgi:hypothetical protein